MKGFTVIDKKTGSYPNVWSIARRCKWAKNLVYCDIDGFAVMEDGNLILMDDCGNLAYCPKDRFEIVWLPNCDEAEKQADGKCLGFGKSSQDDEPIYACKNCVKCTAFEA